MSWQHLPGLHSTACSRVCIHNRDRCKSKCLIEVIHNYGGEERGHLGDAMLLWSSADLVRLVLNNKGSCWYISEGILTHIHGIWWLIHFYSIWKVFSPLSESKGGLNFLNYIPWRMIYILPYIISQGSTYNMDLDPKLCFCSFSALLPLESWFTGASHFSPKTHVLQ